MCPGLSDDLELRLMTLEKRQLSTVSSRDATRDQTPIQRQSSRGILYVLSAWPLEQEERRLYGVGFAVHYKKTVSFHPLNHLLRALPVSLGQSLRLSTLSGPVNILSICAPTLTSPAEVKDQFYEALETTIRKIPATEQLYMLGDFNARVGDDHRSWPRSIGHFGIGKMNENGQRLLELCS